MRFFRRRWRSGPLLRDATTDFIVVGTVPDADLSSLRLETPPSTQGELNALAQATTNIRASSIAAATFTAAAAGAMSGALRADAVGDLSASATSSMAALGTTGQILYVGGAVASKVGITGTSSTVSLAALTGGIAAAPVEGDVVIALYVVGSAGDTTLAITDGTTPYTVIDSEVFADGSASDTNLRVAYKVMGPTPDTTVTFGPTNNASWAGAMIVQVWRNVDTVNPIEAAADAVGTASSRPDGPSITPTTTGAVVVVAGGGATTTAAALNGGGLNNFLTTSGADTIDAVAGMGAYFWGEGAYDPPAWTGGTAVAGDSWAAVTFALKPVPLGLIETAMVANATGALSGALRATATSALTASAASTFAAKGTLKAVEFIGTCELSFIAPASPIDTALNGFDLVGPGGSNLVQQGDLIIIAVNHGSTVGDRAQTLVDKASGVAYTDITPEFFVDGSTHNVDMKVAYFINPHVTGTTLRILYTCTGGASEQTTFQAHIYRGVDPADPIGVVETATGTGTIKPTPPTIQTTNEGSLIGMVVGAGKGTGTLLTGHKLTNYRQNAEISHAGEEVLVSHGWRVATTDTPFVSSQWGGGIADNAGYAWAAVAFEVNGYVPDNTTGALASTAAATFSGIGAAIASGVLLADAYAWDGDFVSEESALTETVLSAAAVAAFAAVGTGIVTADLSASAAGAMSPSATGIGSGVLVAAGVGSFAPFGNARVPGALAAAATASLAAGSTAIRSGAFSSSALSASSYTGRATFTAVLAAASTSALAATATSFVVAALSGGATSSATFPGGAAASGALTAAAFSSMAAGAEVTVEGVLTVSAAAPDALFFASTIAESFLISDAVSLLTARGAYGGAAGQVSSRMIYVGTLDRELILGPEPREIVLEAVERVIYIGELPRDVIG